MFILIFFNLSLYISTLYTLRCSIFYRFFVLDTHAKSGIFIYMVIDTHNTKTAVCYVV